MNVLPSKKDIYELIKSHFPDSGVVVSDIEIKQNEELISVLRMGKSTPFSEYIENRFFKKSTSGDIFYHFVPYKYLKGILEDKKIRLYNLNKYLKDDSTEFSYFLERLGIKFPNFEEQILKIKETTFVFSCTTDNTLNKHWERFGKEEKVVCLKLKINLTGNADYAVHIQKVAYSTELSKLFSLQESMFERYGKRLEVKGWSNFSNFTKRGLFEWEKEIRLSFDNTTHNICDRLGMPSSKEDVRCDNGTPYIEIPLKNKYFELIIEEVKIKEDNWQNDLKSSCEKENLILTKD